MKYFSLVVVLLVSGCTVSIDGEDYLEATQQFDLVTFFDGNVKAWGIVQGRRGELVQRFEVDIAGEVKQGNLTLDESFTYQLGDGVKKRIWNISEQGGGKYAGSADDIAVAQGQVFGNAFNWGYEMDLPVGDTTYRVKFDDWIWAFDNKTIVNRSYIKKFGITMAEVTIFMQKQS